MEGVDGEVEFGWRYGRPRLGQGRFSQEKRIKEKKSSGSATRYILHVTSHNKVASR